MLLVLSYVLLFTKRFLITSKNVDIQRSNLFLFIFNSFPVHCDLGITYLILKRFRGLTHLECIVRQWYNVFFLLWFLIHFLLPYVDYIILFQGFNFFRRLYIMVQRFFTRFKYFRRLNIMVQCFFIFFLLYFQCILYHNGITFVCNCIFCFDILE